MFSKADIILSSPGNTTPLKDKLLEKLKMRKVEKNSKKNSVSSLDPRMITVIRKSQALQMFLLPAFSLERYW
jgi:hypothetical protein